MVGWWVDETDGTGGLCCFVMTKGREGQGRRGRVRGIMGVVLYMYCVARE